MLSAAVEPPKHGWFEAWEEGAPQEHPGQTGAQLSPGTESSSAGCALTPGMWLVALPARSNELHRLLHPCCRWLWGSSDCIGTSCPMGPMQGDIYAWSVLPWELAVNIPSMVGMSRDTTQQQTWPWGFPPGPALQVSDAQRPPHAPVALQIFLASVCYSNGSGWGPTGLRRLYVLMLCGIAWSTVCFKSKMRRERQLVCSRTFREKMAPNLLSWKKK